MNEGSESVFAFVGGEHNTYNAKCTLRGAGIPEVPAHENIHGRVFDETCDGALFATAVHLHRACKVAGQAFPDGLSEYIELISQNSLFAHEAAATYLGVKMPATSFDAHAQKQSVPKKYLEYYIALSSVIDSVFYGPNVQAVIGWGLTVYSFSSRLILSARNHDWRSVVPTSEEHLPDWRLRSLLELLSASSQQLFTTLQSEFASTCNENDVAPWDFQSKVAWKTTDIPTDLQAKLDVRLVDATFQWLLKSSDVGCIDFDREADIVNERLRGLRKHPDADLPNKAADEFREALRSVAGSLDLDRPGDSERELFEKLRDLSAANIDLTGGDDASANAPNLYERIGDEQARSVIMNTSCADVSDQPHGLLEGDSLFTSLSSLRIVSAEPPDHLDHWFINGSPDESLPLPPDTQLQGRFPKQLVLEWLGRRRIRAEAGQTVPEVSAVAIGLQSSFDHGRLLLEASSDIERHGIIELIAGRLKSKLCWYWTGSFLQCIAENKNHADVRFKSFILDLETFAGEVIELHIMVLTVPGLPGCMMRAYGGHAATAMAANLCAFHEQGHVAPMEDGDFDSIRNTVIEAIGNLSKYWKEF